jgi:phosphoenolpyruvate-protein phosphotransferase
MFGFNQSEYARATDMTPHAGQPQTSRAILLKAPLSGHLMPIERVPDPVFAQKMVGDGVSIDPVSQRLLSPCDGTVVQVHSAGHAVTIATAGGVEVMIHIGLDTVQLKGRGFTPAVKAGETVATGALLIEFDADYIATHAKSLLTQIVVTTMDRVATLTPRSGSVAAGSDVILELILADAQVEAQPAAGGTVISDAILVPNPTGLHARPAAVLANLAKKFKADIRLRRGDDLANAKSVVSIMGLEVGYGDKVNLVAQGPDADEAIAALVPALTRGLGDEGTAPASAPASMMVSEVAAPAPRPRSVDPNVLLGVAASPGLAVGNVFQMRHEEIVFPENADDSYRERRTLDDAIEQAKLQLEALQARLKGEANPGKAAIFAAHQELLEDPDLMEIAVSAITKGKSAPFAWRRAFRTYAESLATLKNELLAARANDLRDVGERVLRLLTGAEAEQPELPAQTILIAEDLTPSDIASLDRTRVLGFCTTAGGASSHVSILARSLDITAVAGIDPAALDVSNNAAVILDGRKGTLRLNPSADEVARIRRLQERQATKRKADLETALQAAITGDGHRVEVVANIGGLSDAEQAVRLGGEGVGLLRSEFLFMGRAVAPTEDEQTEAYREIAVALGPERPLIIRTLDVGGDKPLPYLPIPKEDNPFLGERGIRVGLDRPEILRTQVRAILRASQAGKVLAMFPMIATLSEWRAARAILEEERERLRLPPIPVGIMVEVPAAAIMAEQFAREADFFSIGTNDLTQYVLAMDRGHPKLAPQVDGLNPAVLRLIAGVVEAAHQEKKWVGVCGGIAGDPQAVPLLIGLGVDELSVSVPTIPGIKAEVRALRLADCRRLVQEALRQDTAADVRALCPNRLEDGASVS